MSQGNEPGPSRVERNLSRVSGESGPATLLPTLPAGLRPIGPSVPLPGYVFPPEGALWFDFQGEVDIVAGTSVNVITFNVPAGQKCRIRGVGFGADDEVSLRFLSWSLLVANDPHRTYGTNLANIGNILDLAEIFVFVNGQTQVTLRLTQDANAIQTYHVVARITGWTYVEVGG